MEITPGRAMYSPDEELKPLRLPKAAAPNSRLSINAAEFVPRYGQPMPHNLQERLQIHQKLYIQKNYQQYQQPEQQQQQQQQPQQHYQQQQQSYSNGYANQQQQQQQYLQSPHNMNTQMSSLSISSNVQDRLRNSQNGGCRGSGGGIYHYQQQQQQQRTGGGSSGSQQSDYHQNNHYRYNKSHHNHNQHQQHNHNTHQHRYNNHHKQQQQQQQQYYQQQNQQQSNASAVAESANDMENIALEYLQTVIQCLNQNPGQFDTIATRFITIFDGMENNQYVLSNAMEDIFDESIKNPNFRYMGAKLYNLLHMLNPSNDSLFQKLLKLKLDFHQEQVREYMQNKQEVMVRETALFLAELYMQLRGDDSRIYLIAENIIFSLKELLSMEDNKDNIRCICLTLKLAGYDLTSDCAGDMKEIIAKLDAINCQNPGKYPLASNVISLQKNNWGRKPCNSDTLVESGISKLPQPLRHSDDPVFYGPDGREITAEECEFLTNGAAGTAASSDNEDENDDVDLDPEMDEETERDFKLFLKESNNKS